MSVTIRVAGVDFVVPSGASDTNWAAQQVAFEQAVAAALLVPPTWVALSLTNGWANIVGSQAAQYYKDAAGTVHIRFDIDSGNTGTVAFTLPSGSRPLHPVYLTFVAGAGLGLLTLAINGQATISDYVGSPVVTDGCFASDLTFSTVA